MQQATGVGIESVGQEQGIDPAFLARVEIGRDTLRLLFPAALCAGLVAAVICFILLAREARGELADLTTHYARLLDGRLQGAIELAVLEPMMELPAGASIQSRLQGPLTADGAVEIRAIVQDPGKAGQAGRRLSVTMPHAALARGLQRDVPRLGRLDLLMLAAEPVGVWDLARGRKLHSSTDDIANFLSACKFKQVTALAVVQGRLVACALVPSAASYLLVSADPVSFYHSTLRRSLTLFLITGLLFLCGVMVAHRGQRRYLTSLFTAAETLRQDVFRRRESIRHLRGEAVGHAEARRIADFGRWATRLRDGSFYWHEVDDEVARIYGVNRQNLIGALADSPHNLHPDDSARIADHWAYINVKLFPYMLRYRLIQPGGTIREIIDIGEPWYGIDGEVLGFHGIVQDVTGRIVDIAQGIIRPPSRSKMLPQS